MIRSHSASETGSAGGHRGAQAHCARAKRNGDELRAGICADGCEALAAGGERDFQGVVRAAVVTVCAQRQKACDLSQVSRPRASDVATLLLQRGG